MAHTKMPAPKLHVVSSNDIASYALFTAQSAVPSPRIPHRDLLPLQAHPERTAPTLPRRPELQDPPEGWTRSYHATPAAFPKELKQANGVLDRLSEPFSTGSVPQNESKEARKKRNLEEAKNCMRARYDADERLSVEDAQEPKRGMWQHVERWRRTKPSGRGKTLVVTHANGMQKEHWHPVLRDLLARSPDAPGALFGAGSRIPATHVEIDDIFLLDDMNHGASVDLNAGRLGPAQSWRDDTRDVLNFVAHVLPGIQSEAPWHLQWHASGSPRKVIGMGHSFGGNALAQAAAARPDLFEALFLVDPICPPHTVSREAALADPAKEWALAFGAIKRRSRWPSRQAAKEAMLSTPFYASWDAAVFETTVSHGLVPVDPSKPEGEVTLATPNWCEAAVFTEPTGFARGWDALGKLDMPVGFLMAGDPVATLGEKSTQEMVWRPRLARNERVMDAGHLIVQEQPARVADGVWRFLTSLEAGVWGGHEVIRAGAGRLGKAKL